MVKCYQVTLTVEDDGIGGRVTMAEILEALGKDMPAGVTLRLANIARIPVSVGPQPRPMKLKPEISKEVNT